MDSKACLNGYTKLPRSAGTADSARVVRVHVEGRMNMTSVFGSSEGGMLKAMGVKKADESPTGKQASYVM